MIRGGDFSKHLIENVEPEASFEPAAWYDPDGDCVEFLASGEPFYAQRIDDFVTVYYGRESQELVGSMIKGLDRLFDRFPGFRGVEIRDGRVRLSHLFRVSAWSSRDEGAMLIYEKIIRAAEAQDTELDLEGCSA